MERLRADCWAAAQRGASNDGTGRKLATAMKWYSVWPGFTAAFTHREQEPLRHRRPAGWRARLGGKRRTGGRAGTMDRANQIGERGGSKFNLIVTLLILGAMVFGAVKVVPVYFANYQFQDAIESESRFALTGYPKKNADDIRDDIYKKAQELGIPVKPDSIQVVVGNGTVDIAVSYSVPIDLAVYQWTPQFHPHADNHSI